MNGNSWTAKRQGAIGLERQTTVGTETDIRERERQRNREDISEGQTEKKKRENTRVWTRGRAIRERERGAEQSSECN